MCNCAVVSMVMVEAGIEQDIKKMNSLSSESLWYGQASIFESKTAFTRCWHTLKTVKNVTDRPHVHTKTAHFSPADFESRTLTSTFRNGIV